MTTTSTSGARVPVAPIAPQGPALTLLDSAVAPPEIPDDAFELNEEQLASLPEDIRLEIATRKNSAWMRGIAFLPYNQTAAVNRAPNDVTTARVAFVPPNAVRVECDPFLITTQFSCSSFGFEELDYRDRAIEQNDLATPEAIEREFWDGAIAQATGAPNRYLTQTGVSYDVTPTPGTPVSIATGFALLQDALRFGLGLSQKAVGAKGMIHCIPGAAPSLVNVRRVGKFMLDEFDNIVIPGVGYSGNGPIGNANATPPAGKSWLYATDMVQVRVEQNARTFPDSFAEALDRGQNGEPNTITFDAERNAMAYFDNFRHYCVYVNLPST